MIRQPIVVVMGHVDHGKTSILDAIRKTTIAKKEAGGITQHIGASEVPREVINQLCSKILNSIGANLIIPGLLFLDTPGHEAFSNLRQRGGSVADIAIVVIDVNEGFGKQTFEVINILKKYRTPFVVAANKIDLIQGWTPANTYSITESLNMQNKFVIERLDEKIYNIVAQLANYNIESERFDRVKNFTKEAVIIPVSAKTKEGIAELLAFVSGLSQKYLEERLKIEVEGPGKGSIIEAKEEKGLGPTIDVVLYDGTLKVGDSVAFSTGREVKVTKVRGILRPKPLVETKSKARSGLFENVDKVSAAAGIKILAQDLEDAIPGSPFVVVNDPNDPAISEIKSEVSNALKADSEGIIVNGDSIGSLEGIKYILAGKVKIGALNLGKVTKEDVALAISMKKNNPKYGIIVAFNVPVPPEVEEECRKQEIFIVKSKVIYEIPEYLEKKFIEIEEAEKNKIIQNLVMPGKIRVLKGYCFRVSNPAIFGVRVEAGTIKPGYNLINSEGKVVGKIKSIQSEKVALQSATKGQEVAISVEDAVFGKKIFEDMLLYNDIPMEHISLFIEKYSSILSAEERELLLFIQKIKLSSEFK